VVTDLHSAATTAAPPVAWITRCLNDERRAMPDQPRPASELCGEVAEFMGMLGDEEE
jgi:hypothetical protein